MAIGGSPTKREILGYSYGQLGLTATEAFVRIHLLKFFVDQVGLSPILTGLAVGLAIIWDGITDPLMGELSDRLNATRKWRRRVFFVPGALGSALCLILLFSPAFFDSQSAQFFYLLIFYISMNSFLTVFGVPHAALGGAMSPDSLQRSKIFGWRLIFGNVGAVLGVALPALFLSSQVENAYLWSAVAVGILSLSAGLVSWRETYDRESLDRPVKINWNPVSLLRSVLYNHHFLIVLGAYLFAMFGIGINGSLALFFYEYRLELSDAQTQSIIVLFMLCFSLSIPVWIRFAQQVPKKICLAVSIFSLGLSGALIYLIVPPHSFWIPLLYACFGGFLIGVVVLLDVLLVEIVDYDRLRKSQNRLGLYFGIWKMAEKLTRALAVVASGFLLTRIGFVSGAEVSEETSWGLAILFGPVVNAFFIASALLVLRLKFNEARQHRVESLLARRMSKPPQA
ncbi:MAG: MFS transporter [Bradymonadales bacterium]|nr:MAG: MFS transporter [Bradymonadales bacterium]